MNGINQKGEHTGTQRVKVRLNVMILAHTFTDVTPVMTDDSGHPKAELNSALSTEEVTKQLSGRNVVSQTLYFTFHSVYFDIFFKFRSF